VGAGQPALRGGGEAPRGAGQLPVGRWAARAGAGRRRGRGERGWYVVGGETRQSAAGDLRHTRKLTSWGEHRCGQA
jgi:hypothetical protein